MSVGSYTWKPIRSWDPVRREWFVRHPEARAITNYGRQENVSLPDVAPVLKQTYPKYVSGRVPLVRGISTGGRGLVWMPWLLSVRPRPVGGGAFGKAFELVYAGEVARFLERARQTATFVVDHKQPAAGTRVILKVAADPYEGQKIHRQGQVDRFSRDSVRESSWHKALDTMPCLKLSGLARGVCTAQHVPDFYWSGMVVDTYTGRRFYITLMGLAPGQPVQTMFAKSMPPEVYVAVERAVVMMWLYGVAHTDFHKGNVMWDTAGRRATIIDFGQGIKLSDALVARLRQTVPKAVAIGVRSLGELWYPPSKSGYGLGIQEYANRVRVTREANDGRTARGMWYNPDGHALMQMYKLVPRASRSRIAVLRRAAWGSVDDVPGSSGSSGASSNSGSPTSVIARAGGGSMFRAARLAAAAKVPLWRRRSSSASSPPTPMEIDQRAGGSGSATRFRSFISRSLRSRSLRNRSSGASRASARRSGPVPMSIS